MPFGADLKDPLWRWGSFLVGVPSLVVLVWIATLGDVSLWNSWWWMWLVLGILMSLRSGRAWYRGDLAVRAATKEMVPAVEVKGQPGSTAGAAICSWSASSSARRSWWLGSSAPSSS